MAAKPAASNLVRISAPYPRAAPSGAFIRDPDLAL